jgi:hypothetical protein
MRAPVSSFNSKKRFDDIVCNRRTALRRDAFVSDESAGTAFLKEGTPGRLQPIIFEQGP